jgi:UDP-N-acetyl-D-mannosaminuronic acid dehydrogenase
MIDNKKVAVIGLGYIGLPTAALIASRGLNVVGVDIDERVVETIGSGSIHIAEPDLEGLVQKVVSAGSLKVATAVEPADVFIIAVPTPIDGDKSPDLRNVMDAVRSIQSVLAPGNIIILVSTCTVGTTRKIALTLAKQSPDLAVADGRNSNESVSVAYCPERVLPGKILYELIHNHRCIGGVTPQCARKAQRFYKGFVQGTCIATTSTVAEMVKLTENSFRDINIAFANELSLICDRLGANVWEVIDLANRHPRVNILLPGPGVGGHCIAVDPWFLVQSAPDLARVIRTGMEVNDSKIYFVFEKSVALIE